MVTCKICGNKETPEDYINEDTLFKENLCFNCNFWRELLIEDRKRDPHTVCVIDGSHYIILPENNKSFFRGFGGHKFVIKFNDGIEITTTNLWHQGDIPSKWGDKFPDNANFSDK